MKKITVILILLIQIAYANDNYYYKNNQKVILTPNSSMSRSSTTIDYYQNKRGILLGVTDGLIVKLKSVDNLQNYLSEFNLILEKTLGTNLYLLKTQDKNFTIDISNRLSEKDDVAFAHPDFLKKRMKR